MVKNLYIRKADETFWNRAEELASERGVPLSLWLSNLVRSHIYGLGTKQKTEVTVADLINRIESDVAQLQAMLDKEKEPVS